MNENKRVVPVLVVTFNGMPWIDRCLRSLLDSDVKAEVYVVDNASTDGTTGFIGEHYPEVCLFRLENNVGFARANNIGLLKITEQHESAGFPGVMLLNQDAYVMRDTLGALASAADAHPGYGIISPVHLNGTGLSLDSRFAQYCRESGLDADMLFEQAILRTDAPGTVTGRTTDMSYGPTETHSAGQVGKHDKLSQFVNFVSNNAPADPHSDLIDIMFVNAAAWFVTRDCLSHVGLFSPKFFMYGEDHEYLNRVRHAGFKVGIHCRTTILHDREHRAARPEAETEVHYFERKALITLLHPSYGMLEKTHIIFEELFKTFAVRLLRNPVLSIRLLFRKLVILMRVMKCANSPDAD